MCVWVCATHVCMHVWWHIENKPEITVETERKRENFGIRNEIRVLRNFLWDLIFHDKARYWRAQRTCLSVCVFCPLVLLPRIALSFFDFNIFCPICSRTRVYQSKHPILFREGHIIRCCWFFFLGSAMTCELNWQTMNDSKPNFEC